MKMRQLTVAVATYKRPGMLLDLLESLRIAVERVEDFSIEVVVIDNDSAMSARAVCEDFDGLNIQYSPQPKPGISATRNAAVARAVGEFIVFVDDDERVDPRWLQELLEVQSRTGCDMVAGPVLSVLPVDTPQYILDSRLFDREERVDLSYLKEAGTGNLLCKRSLFEELSADDWFKEDFSLTGGGDAEFTRRLHRGGATIVWAAKAIVWESVPPSRVSLRWLARRFQRVGSVDYRLSEPRALKRLRGLISGATRFCVGLVSACITFVFTQRISASAFRRTFRGVGYFRGALGRGVVEYGRGKP